MVRRWVMLNVKRVDGAAVTKAMTRRTPNSPLERVGGDVVAVGTRQANLTVTRCLVKTELKP